MSRSSRPFREGLAGIPERLAEVLPPDPSLRDEYGYVLWILEEKGGDCGVAVLAREMAHARRSNRREDGGDPSVEAVDYQSTYLSLQREYLPTLVTLGIVEYDRTDGTVTLVRDAVDADP